MKSESDRLHSIIAERNGEIDHIKQQLAEAQEKFERAQDGFVEAMKAERTRREELVISNACLKRELTDAESTEDIVIEQLAADNSELEVLTELVYAVHRTGNNVLLSDVRGLNWFAARDTGRQPPSAAAPTNKETP